MNTTPMYASRKRRKPIQKSVKPPPEGAKSNPSKRHRDRLNGELERLANLLPFPQDVISKLDKLTVLRLSVSYLRAKSFFNVTLKSNSCPRPDNNGLKQTGEDILEGELLLQVLSGFVLVVTADGIVFYASSTIQDYLGFHQSDVIHQNVYDLIHTEDRPEFQRQLHWALNPTLSSETEKESPDSKNAALPLTYYKPEQLPPENSTFLERNFVCRLRCLLDNSSGFLAMSFQGRLKFLHGQNQKTKDGLPIPPQLALFALASPLQAPSILEIRTKNFIFKTKHKLDFTPTACDAKGQIVLGYTEAELCYRGTGYQFIHAADMLYCAENHIRMIKTGESGLTVFRLLTKQNGWVWVQANARLVYKNGKPECIIASQRVLTDEEGEENLKKRNLKLPFNFTTGEAVLYDTSFPKSLDDLAAGNALPTEGDPVQGKVTRSLDPDSLLGARLRQDESVYVCVPAQNRLSFQHDVLSDTEDDLGKILSSDWQDDILSLSENDIFRPEPNDSSTEDKNGDLLSFMNSLGICREDLELIQKDEEILKVSFDEQGDIMDVTDEILSYVQESLRKTSDCFFPNGDLRKASGQSPGCVQQPQQPHPMPQLHQGQPLLLQQQQQPHPKQPNPQQHLHTQQPVPQQHPYPQQHAHAQQHLHTQQAVPQQHPYPQQHAHAHAQQHLHTQQAVPQQHPYPQQLPQTPQPVLQQPVPQQHPSSQPSLQQLLLYPQQEEQPPLPWKQQQHLQQQRHPSQVPAEPQLSHAQQQSLLKQQQGHTPPQPSPPQQQQQQQLCHRLKHMQVNGTCPSLTPPVSTVPANDHPLPSLFRMDQSHPQYGQPFLESSSFELPYRGQLNTLSIACAQDFSPYTLAEELPANEMGDFTPQDLEELIEGLQSGVPGEQEGTGVTVCHPGALPMYQRLSESQTSVQGHSQQLNPMLFSPSTVRQQPFLVQFQNGSSGDMSQTLPESSGGVECPQSGHPLLQHPAESTVYQDLTSRGFM
ncbi:aryl hydrocarbon receptor 1a isoform X1 [Megalops cyprinoides]|uniref:aryl hydrocarbon receptor 1a isoform X1 n=1 Tax=Megalops cyprinoides TaxID=118141 RepID=UPI001863A1FD|nr:aryl hydrocarbon receptor 1a isoform X1 [Megalops cyprinoides]XP_036393992.1 aryl hydrocarbon receptor 1a isoform X1 [Megalops cyprinoides]XP_036393993.1 aryl hydrocarbon receptor 1a isoform X1 [Megalops cyprinoides]